MSASSATTFRPLSLAELLDRAIRLYRNHFLQFVGILALVQIPLQLIQLVSSVFYLESIGAGSTPLELVDPAAQVDLIIPALMLSLIVSITSFVLVQGIATAAFTRAVADSFMGHKVSVLGAYRKLGRSWLTLLGAILLIGLFTIAILFWTIVPIIGWLSGPGMLVFIALVLTPLIAPIVVLEDVTSMGAVRRAWDLARGRFWHLLALMLLLIIFAQLIVTGPSALLGVLFQYISDSPSAFGGFAPGLLQTLSQALVGLATGLLYLPLQLCAITLVYFDLRVRREGFDLAWKAQSDNQEHSDIFTITQNAPKPEEGNWITGRELGYFALISIAIIALYALLFGLALALIALMFNSGFGL